MMYEEKNRRENTTFDDLTRDIDMTEGEEEECPYRLSEMILQK